jgi:hypothetical protein
MAVCEWCGQDMLAATTCTGNLPFEVDGATYKPVPAEEDCGCGVSAGGLHHPGCDLEVCPRCGGQRLHCNCANPVCGQCNQRMEYDGADDEHSYYSCPTCGAEAVD